MEFNIDDDGDEADLFSFGQDMETGANSSNSSDQHAMTNSETENKNNHTAGGGGAARKDSSDESFLDLFDSTPTTTGATTKSGHVNSSLSATGTEQQENGGIDDDDDFFDVLDIDNSTAAIGEAETSGKITDKETLDILNWLDESPSETEGEEIDLQPDVLSVPSLEIPELPGVPIQQDSEQQKQLKISQQEKSDDDNENAHSNEPSTEKPTSTSQQQPTIVSLPPIPKPGEIVFNTLREALESTKSTKEEICELFVKENHRVEDELRPQLWCRVVIGKTCQEALQTSLADSFQQWQNHRQELQQQHQNQKNYNKSQKKLNQWIEKSSMALAPRLVDACPRVYDSNQKAKEAIQSLLQYHYENNNNSNNLRRQQQSGETKDELITDTKTTSTEHQQQHDSDESLGQPPAKTQANNSVALEIDPLLPPIICTILSSGVSTTIASVLLAHITPTYMPFLALTNEERCETAAKIIHTQFYLLACYHLPSLVYHLDRYVPGWLWPKRRQQEYQQQTIAETTSSSTAGNSTSTESNNNNSKIASASPTEKGRHLKEQGVIPQSWLITHLAGECCISVDSDDENDGDKEKNKENNTQEVSEGKGAESTSIFMIGTKRLRALWDIILTNNNNSLRFFLVLAILEKYSDNLLLLTGDDLLHELNKLLEFGSTADSSNSGASDAVNNATNNLEKIETHEDELGWVHEWASRANALQESTPESVVYRLRTAEDDAVVETLQGRQKKIELQLQQRLEAEARAYRLAQERKADEARLRLTRARLIEFYRKFNPERECNVDKIMDTYSGRYDELDAHLKQKYGVGFNPALKPKPLPSGGDNSRGNFLSTMNLGRRKQQQNDAAHNQTVADNDGNGNGETHRKVQQFAVLVEAKEVLPVVCWTKEAVAARSGASATSADTTATARHMMMRNKGKKTNTNSDHNDRDGIDKNENEMPLKFYLIDSRTEAAANEQGRFPTSSSLTPESLLDPEKLMQNEDIYETFRGSAHICVMGEGISAIPSLYGQKLTPKLEELMIQDASRTHNCALFFFKRGFPFVSVLDGGFAAAHAWLVREGAKPPNNLKVTDVLMDYDENSSLFGQMEVLYREQQAYKNANAKEKTQRSLQNLLDNSLTSITRSAIHIEKLTQEIDSHEGRQQIRQSVTKFFPFNRDNNTNNNDNNAQSSTPASSTIKVHNAIKSTKDTNTGEAAGAEQHNNAATGLQQQSASGSMSSQMPKAATTIHKNVETKMGNTGRPISKKKLFGMGVPGGWNLHQETNISDNNSSNLPSSSSSVSHTTAKQSSIASNNSNGNSNSIRSTHNTDQQHQQQQKIQPVATMNRFAGLAGAVLNNSIKKVGVDGNVDSNNSNHSQQQHSSTIKMNPFGGLRFGSNINASNNNNTKTENSGNHGGFAGLGKFGRSTLERMKVAGASVTDNNSTNHISTPSSSSSMQVSNNGEAPVGLSNSASAPPLTGTNSNSSNPKFIVSEQQQESKKSREELDSGTGKLGHSSNASIEQQNAVDDGDDEKDNSSVPLSFSIDEDNDEELEESSAGQFVNESGGEFLNA